MKLFIGTSISIILLVIILFFTSLKSDPDQGTIPYDDEQEGIKEQIVINFSHVVAENTPKGLAAQSFANLVMEKTDGKVKVEVFPNGVLYSDSNEIDALIRGEVEMIAPSISNVTSLIPEWGILDLPFIFKDNQHVKDVLNGEVGAQFLEMLAEQNIKGLTFWSNGFKQITSDEFQLIKPSDFNGLRFRIMQSKTIEEQFHLLGVKTNVMPFNQVYRGLETRYLDGQENTISNIYSKRFYTVQNYLTISNHGYLGYAILVNDDFWETLPKDIQEKIQEALFEITNWSYDHSIKINDQQLNLINAYKDIEIYELTEKERQEWIDFFDPLYKMYESRNGKKLLTDIENYAN